MEAIKKRDLIIQKAEELGLENLANQFKQIEYKTGNTIAPEAKESIMFEDMFAVLKDEPFNGDVNKIWMEE